MIEARIMLHINDLVYRIGGRLLFDQATVHVPAGQRIGLVGRNGAGKSTLFKLILGEASPDGGSLTIRPRSRVGWVSQEAPEGSQTLTECVLAADSERERLLAESETSHDGHHLAEIHERLNAIDAHSAPARAATILSGLGFDSDAQSRPVGSFSGGWRMRVALAAALFANPDLLLLDEPTNHLDLEATLWLQNYLASYPGTVLVISHDRELLNDVCTRIIHLEHCKLVSYGGNYDSFERVRREKIDLASKAHAKQLEQRKKIQSFIDRFRAKATKAAQAQSRIKMLERMGPSVAVIEDKAMVFDFPDPEQLSPPILAIDGGIAGYDGNPVLSGLSLRVDMDDRIALLGANGNGKSTLSKVIAGRLKLMEGELIRPPKLRIGYFAQHQTDELTAGRTARDHMADVMKGMHESKVRAHLGRFGFGQERADVKVENLSGGEKARLLFALMTRDAPHLMVLDEPTNHLDIDAREALVSALNAYEGAVVLVSHDPHLIELVADRLLLVSDGKVTNFDGDLAAYRAFLLERARDARRGNGNGGGGKAANANRKEERRAAADARAQQAPLRKKVQEAEKRLERMTTKKAAIAATLADPKLYDSPPDKITALQRDLAEAEKAIATAETEWLEATEALEAAKAG